MAPSGESGSSRSSRLRLLACGGFAAAAVIVWSAAYQIRFTSLWYPDACDYAQLGRQIVRGEGMTSQQSFPYVLSWLGEHGHPTTAPWPNVTRFVLPPLQRAASFAVFGTSDLAALLPDALFFAATVALSFSLAAMLAGPAAGWSAAVLILLSPTMLHYALSGLSETGAAFFLTATAWIVVAMVRRADPLPRTAMLQAAGLGLVLGLGFLQRSNLVFGLAAAAAILLWYWSAPLRLRLGAVAVCFAVAALVALPWLVRNAAGFGSPTFSLTVDRNVAMALLGRDPFDDFALISPGRVIAEHMHEAFAYVSPAWLVDHWRELFGEDLRLFAAAFVATALLPLAAAWRVLRAYLWIMVVLTYVLSAPLVIHTHARYYQPFAPLAVVLVVSAAVMLLRPLHRGGVLLPALVSTLVAFSWLFRGFADEVPRRSPKLEEWDRLITESVAQGAVVASDQSWYVSWQADRPSVRFHGDAGQLAELERRFTPVAALWLGRGATAKLEGTLAAAGADSRWRVVARGHDGTTFWLRADRGRSGDGEAPDPPAPAQPPR